MPNRFAWIAAAAVLTALGIVTAPDEYVSPTVSKRKVHRHRDAAGPTEPAPPPAPTIVDLTYVAVPAGVTLPPSDRGDVFLPDTNVRLIVIGANDTGTFAVSTEPPASKIERGSTPKPPAMKTVPRDDLAEELRELADDVARLQLIIVADARVTWRPRIDIVLSTAADAGLPVVFFAVSTTDGSPGIRTYKYPTYPSPSGGKLAVLPERDNEPLDGGVVRVDVVAGQPMFRFIDEESAKAIELSTLIGEYHTEFLDTAPGASRYADAGTAWTVRPAASAPWGAVIDAIGMIRGVGVSRVGIEWPR